MYPKLAFPLKRSLIFYTYLENHYDVAKAKQIVVPRANYYNNIRITTLIKPKALYTTFSTTKSLHHKENHSNVTKNNVYWLFNNQVLTP
jgi:hypothetical protein